MGTMNTSGQRLLRRYASTAHTMTAMIKQMAILYKFWVFAAQVFVMVPICVDSIDVA
jgi:hypothetical protein